MSHQLAQCYLPRRERQLRRRSADIWQRSQLTCLFNVVASHVTVCDISSLEDVSLLATHWFFDISVMCWPRMFSLVLYFFLHDASEFKLAPRYWNEYTCLTGLPLTFIFIVLLSPQCCTYWLLFLERSRNLLTFLLTNIPYFMKSFRHWPLCPLLSQLF